MTEANTIKFIAADMAKKHQTKIRFFLVGIWNAVFGYLVFVLLDTFFSHVFQKRYYAYMAAITFAQIISVVNAYVFHKNITFKSNARNSAMIVEFFRFSMTYIVAFCFIVLFLPIFVELLHLTPQIAGAALLLITTAISYLGHSRFSFRDERSIRG